MTDYKKSINNKNKAPDFEFLSGHGRQEMQPNYALLALSEYAQEITSPDRYGLGDVVQDFEKAVSKMLGMDRAMFLPTGTMAQQIAIRVCSERTGINRIAFHPTSHLELHESLSYQHLHKLQAIKVGQTDRLIRISDVKNITSDISVLILELPQSELGGELPDWDSLVEICSWVKSKGIHLHLDGARLWETQPFFNRDLKEICGLFNSVYVSFYKTIGAIGGAMLLGSNSFIEQSLKWRHRHGGNIYRFYPYVLSAKKGIESRLNKIPLYCSKAIDIAESINQIEGVTTRPLIPHTNMMYVYLEGKKTNLLEASAESTTQNKILVYSNLEPTSKKGVWRFTIWVGDSTLEISTEKIKKLIETIVRSRAFL